MCEFVCVGKLNKAHITWLNTERKFVYYDTAIPFENICRYFEYIQEYTNYIFMYVYLKI